MVPRGVIIRMLVMPSFGDVKLDEQEKIGNYCAKLDCTFSGLKINCDAE